MDGGERDAGKGDASLTGRETQVFLVSPSFGRKTVKERKGKGKEKERKERKNEKKERRKGSGSRPWPVVAGGGRKWPEKVAKAPHPNHN